MDAGTRGSIAATTSSRMRRRDARQANDPLPKTPDLSETPEAIARGRELVKEAQRLREQADRQIEEVQTTIEQSDRVLDRSQQLLGDRKGG